MIRLTRTDGKSVFVKPKAIETVIQCRHPEDDEPYTLVVTAQSMKLHVQESAEQVAELIAEAVAPRKEEA